jgi:hypothetical protein
MGHPRKEQRAKPGMTNQEFWGVFCPLYESGFIDRLIETGRRREEINRMKRNHRKLLEKNRLLKRKIREFNR